MKLISFELSKLIKSRKNIIIFILMIIGVDYLYHMFTALPGASTVNSYIWENNLSIQDNIDNTDGQITDKSVFIFMQFSGSFPL